MQLYDLQGFNVCHAKATSIMQRRRAAHGQRTQKNPASIQEAGLGELISQQQPCSRLCFFYVSLF